MAPKPHSKITAEALAAAGYQTYRTGLDLADGGRWQKTIRCAPSKTFPGGAKRYFINFTLSQCGASCSVRLYAPDSPSPDGGIEVQPLLDAEAEIEGVEAWIEKTYLALGCVPDVHNN